MIGYQTHEKYAILTVLRHFAKWEVMKLVKDKVNEGESDKQLFAAGAGRSILYISLP